MARTKFVRHSFRADTDPGYVMEWIQRFLWDYVEENNHPDPAEYDCWIKDNITVTVKIKQNKP